MARYFLHVRDGDQFEGYLDGADSGTAQEAVEEPISATRELIAATILAGDLVDGQVLEITDESGSVGVIVPFRSALKLE